MPKMWMQGNLRMTAQEALIELREMIQRNTVELSWDSRPFSFESLIRAREGDKVLDQIYEVIDQ